LGATVRAGVAVAIIAASVLGILGGGPAWPACPPGQSHNCVNLDLVPQIAQQIIADERLAAPPKAAAPASAPQQPYTGPTVGVSPMIPRAPTVGYRWSLD
jgi:hypothetical protein